MNASRVAGSAVAHVLLDLHVRLVRSKCSICSTSKVSTRTEKEATHAGLLGPRCDEEGALAARLLLEKVVSFQEGCGPYLLGAKPPIPSSISNTGLIDGVPLPIPTGFTTFVAH
jgi:hypothetical protein